MAKGSGTLKGMVETQTGVRVEFAAAGVASTATGLPVLDHLIGELAVTAGLRVNLEVAPGSAGEEVAAAGRALGIGLGSPIAGWLSGRRVELRLVLIGATGMIALLVAAAIFIADIGILIACIVGIGFFTGFYIVPLFTLLQHKAPKASKGEMIAISNFINVTGAIASTLLFFTVVFVSQRTGLAPPVSDREELGTGTLTNLTLVRGRPLYFAVVSDDWEFITLDEKPEAARPLSLQEVIDDVFGRKKPEAIIELAKGIKAPKDADHMQEVSVSRYHIAGVAHYDLVFAGAKPDTDYDLHRLPRFLFLGAAALTLGILLILAKPLMQVRREEG